MCPLGVGLCMPFTLAGVGSRLRAKIKYKYRSLRNRSFRMASKGVFYLLNEDVLQGANC